MDFFVVAFDLASSNQNNYRQCENKKKDHGVLAGHNNF
jgi:hypothetical protein